MTRLIAKRIRGTCIDADAGTPEASSCDLLDDHISWTEMPDGSTRN
jgi:hypothetical protein